jgi:hypothetical protein
MQLDKLIVCRFNNLATDVQRILRTASIIGTNFTGPLLLGVLPRHLKDQMSSSIDILVHQKWLFQDMECDTAYEFTHPHAHRLIYQLTPSSERNHMHQAIAEYIEETYGIDPTQFAALSYHYQHCDTDKALHYCVQAVDVLLNSITVIFDFGECIDLLYGSFVCSCKTSFDCDVMHKLVNLVTAAIERCDITPQQSEKIPSTLWQSAVQSFFRAISSLGTLAITPRTNSTLSAVSSKSSVRYQSSARVVPTVSSRGEGPLMEGNMTSSSSRGHTGDSVKAFNDSDYEERDSFRDSVKSTSDMEFERRAKKEFLQQLDRLHEQINQKQADIVLMRIGGGGGGEKEDGAHCGGKRSNGAIRFGSSIIADAPSDWQLDFLQL